MTDNKEFAVVQVIPRASGATTYVLNAVGAGGKGVTTVFHSKHGPMTCMNPTCAATFIAGDARHKGCVHTRVAMRYLDAHGESEVLVTVGSAFAVQDATDTDDVDEAYR